MHSAVAVVLCIVYNKTMNTIEPVSFHTPGDFIYFLAPLAMAGFITAVLFDRFGCYNASDRKKRLIQAAIFSLAAGLCMLFPDSAANIDLNNGAVVIMAAGLYAGYAVVFFSAFLMLFWKVVYLTSAVFPGSMVVFILISAWLCGAMGSNRIRNKETVKWQWLLKTSFYNALLFILFSKGSAFGGRDSFLFTLTTIYAGLWIFFRILESGKQSFLRARDEQEKLAVKTQFELLKSQINPHFLFNALNTIASFIHRDPDRAKELIINLSGFLRSSLKEKKDFLTLDEEIELVKEYISIEKARFSEKVQFEFNLEKNSTQIKVPFFIVQPLVENAVKHGRIENRILKITVSARLQDSMLHIIVADNGAGMSQDQLNMLFKDQLEEKPIGLYNIKRRIEIIYPEGNFLIQSEPDVGTRIHIIIPGEKHEKTHTDS